jgi:hypothetical protein
VELARAEPALEMLRRNRHSLRQQLIGHSPRGLDEVDVLLEVGEPQQRRAALARAEVFARPALDQVRRAVPKPSLFS